MERAMTNTKPTIDTASILSELLEQQRKLADAIASIASQSSTAPVAEQPSLAEQPASAVDEDTVKQLQEAAKKHEKALAKRAKAKEAEKAKAKAQQAQAQTEPQAPKGGKAPSDVSLLARSAVRGLYKAKWKPEGFTALEMANHLGVKRYIVLNALYYLERNEGIVTTAGEGPKPEGVTKGLPPKLWKWTK